MNTLALDKKTINVLISKHITPERLGRPTKIPLWRIVKMILYRIKTGCQWRELPIDSFCRKRRIGWQAVYYHYNKWSKSGIWKAIWHDLLKTHK